MSTVGPNSTIQGILDKSLDLEPLKPVNPGGRIKYYCPNCYGYDLYYREVETGIFDVTCLACNKHWEKKLKNRAKCNKYANLFR